MLTLNITTREAGKKLDEVRAQGLIPAVMYGHKQESLSLSVSKKDFLKVYKEAGESSVIQLKGEGHDHQALIHDMAIDPVSYEPTHVDFYIIEKGKKVTVSVPLEFDGVAPAVKELGGNLIKVLHEVEVEAMPKDLPHELVVDVSVLVDFDAQIHVSDIKLPAGVELVTDAEEVVALVQAAKEEEEAEPAVFDPNAIQVEEKGKKEEEAAE